MLQKLVSSLRNALTSVTRAERTQVDRENDQLRLASPSILRWDAEAASFELRKGTILSELRHLREHFISLDESGRRVVLTGFDEALDTICKHVETLSEAIKSTCQDPSKEMTPSQFSRKLLDVMRPELMLLASSITGEVSTKLDILSEKRLEDLKSDLRSKLEPTIKNELRQSLQDGIKVELVDERRRLEDAIREEALVSYLKERNWTGLEDFIDHIPLRLRLEAKEALRRTLAEIRDEALREATKEASLQIKNAIERNLEHPLREGVFKALLTDKQLTATVVAEELRRMKADPGHPLREGVFKALLTDKQLTATVVAEELGRMEADPGHPFWKQVESKVFLDQRLRSKVEAQVKSQLVPQVRALLLDELKPKIREELEREMLIPVLVDMDGNLEGRVAGILKRNLANGINSLRENVKDEIWKHLATAILESWAVVLLPGELDETNPKNAERKELDDPELVQRFAELARDLVDDRILPALHQGKRDLQIPSGFYRAVRLYFCDMTQSQIEIGDFYVAFRGLRIRIPMEESTAEDLVCRTQANAWPDASSEVEPPWEGFPYDDLEDTTSID